ncbi:hypothetical protein B0H14DRAFT_1189647, partial [Mycena olivaceomarginata]
MWNSKEKTTAGAQPMRHQRAQPNENGTSGGVKCSFGTDVWTLPNHRGFVAWTIHLQYKGVLVSFLIDIFEVPKSHTGETLATAFQEMLDRYDLSGKILAVVWDNATSNDTQLSSNPNNTFDEANRVRCFNHTAVKSLLRPFQTTTRREGSM